MHHFSQKCVAITNVLVYACIFPLSALEQHKKAEEKKPNFTQNSKIGSDKIIGNLNLIFGYTPFGENN